MTLQELMLSDINVLRQWAIVFNASLAQALEDKWGEFGSTNCVLEPQILVDGRYMLSADVLSEVNPGGLLHEMWISSDLHAIISGTEIIPLEIAVTMLQSENINL